MSQPCPGCGRPFCDDCLVEILGRRLCEWCKNQAVAEMAVRLDRHPLALMSLMVPTLGYLATGGLATVITSTIGLVLGARVLREMRERPYRSGRTLALAGLVVSWGTLAVVVITLVSWLIQWSGRH